VSSNGTKKLKVPQVFSAFSAIDHDAVLMWFLAKLFMLLEAGLPQTLSLVHYIAVSTQNNDSCPTARSSRGAIVDKHGLQMVSY
jgi:hypothetical protein